MTVKSQNFIFKISKTPEVEKKINYLNTRLSGLDNSEIVKLAIVELVYSLQKREKFELTTEEESELEKSLKSGKGSLLTRKKDLENYFS